MERSRRQDPRNCSTSKQAPTQKISPTNNRCSKLENCQVTANIETMRRDKTIYHAVQVAASDRPVKTTTRQMLGHFRKAQVPPKRIVKEFPVTPDAHIPVGKSLDVLVLGHGLRIAKGQLCLQFILFLASSWM